MGDVLIYNPKWRNDPDSIADALKCLGHTAHSLDKRVACPGAHIVNWGFKHPEAVLNRELLGDKLKELELLKAANVPTVPFVTTQTEWVPRRRNHKSASDLTDATMAPDFYVKKLDIDCEFRVHVFGKLVIRCGMKLPKTVDHHPWIRGCDHGWYVDYGKVCQNYITDDVRDAARAAIAAVNYNFGAVDIGIDCEGKPIVFEVNSAPGMVPKTAMAYARQISNCINEIEEGVDVY